tara:strand:+ start:24 stop:290 length:267 start_codon:yes stop_codon:yes gene_type:complete
MSKATGNRKKLDANKDGKISKEDFAMLRNKKGKAMKKTKNGTKKTKMMYGGTAKKKMNMGGGLKKTKKMAKGGVKTKKMSRGGPVRRK